MICVCTLHLGVHVCLQQEVTQAAQWTVFGGMIVGFNLPGMVNDYYGTFRNIIPRDQVCAHSCCMHCLLWITDTCSDWQTVTYTVVMAEWFFTRAEIETVFETISTVHTVLRTL